MKKLVAAAIALLLLLCLSCGSRGRVAKNEPEAQEIEQIEQIEIVNPVDTFSFKGYDYIASVLGGEELEYGDFMPELVSGRAFEVHKKAMQQQWEQYYDYLDSIRTWCSRNIPEKVDTVFYPLSGPDFNYLDAFFPDCKMAVLFGLESGGKLPFVDAASRAHSAEVLSAVRQSVMYNMRASFFVTKDMATDLNSPYLSGTLPDAMMFISRHGYEVIDVNGIDIAEDGSIFYTDSSKVLTHTFDKDFSRGYEIMYRLPEERGCRKICYLRRDLSNKAYDDARVGKLVQRYFKGKVTFLKAASYLPHRQWFARLHDDVLECSSMVVTGPSGLPYNLHSRQLPNELNINC